MLGTRTVSNRSTRLGKCRGQIIIEFALVVPVLLGIAALTIDLANMIAFSHRLMHATREGARVATETSLPIPQGLGSCDVGSCNISSDPSGEPDLCCIGVSRAFIVAFNSGVTNPTVTGTWVDEIDGDGTQHVFFRVDANADVDFFFRSLTRNVTASTTAFANSFEAGEEDAGGGP